MRISSMQIFNIARRGMADVNSDLINTQEQLSSGKRVLRPADDPIAATKIMQITDELNAIEQFKKNIDIAESNLVLEESVLNSVNNVILRMQELAVSAGNTASLTENEYRAMANEVGSRMDELMNLMNTKNANGDYIFGGYKASSEPFVGDSTTGFRYVGDDGQKNIKIASNTTLPATDSGKALFLDVASAENTVQTYASPSNQSNPPVSISVGRVVNQRLYDDFYPKDMVITFNADAEVNPPSKNYTITEKASGRVIVANERFVPGNEIIAHGVSFRVIGTPVSGQPVSEATRAFGSTTLPAFPTDFSGANSETFTVSVGNRTQTLVLDANITSVADLSTVLNDATNGNAGKLADLGITVDSQGFTMANGVNFTIASGTANIDAVMGLDTTNGSTSSDGALKQPGDRLFVDSTSKQGLLTTLARFKDAMETFDGSTDSKRDVSESVALTLSNLSNAQTSVLDVVARVGARINSLESTRDLHLDTELVSKDILSQVRDLDYAEASTRLAQQTLILQAAQQSFIRVSRLNLFERL